MLKNFAHLEQLPSFRIINCRKPTHRRHFPFCTILFRVCKRPTLICFLILCNAIKRVFTASLFITLSRGKTQQKMYDFNKRTLAERFKLIWRHKLWKECIINFCYFQAFFVFFLLTFCFLGFIYSGFYKDTFYKIISFIFINSVHI